MCCGLTLVNAVMDMSGVVTMLEQSSMVIGLFKGVRWGWWALSWAFISEGVDNEGYHDKASTIVLSSPLT